MTKPLDAIELCMRRFYRAQRWGPGTYVWRVAPGTRLTAEVFVEGEATDEMSDEVYELAFGMMRPVIVDEVYELAFGMMRPVIVDEVDAGLVAGEAASFSPLDEALAWRADTGIVAGQEAAVERYFAEVRRSCAEALEARRKERAARPYRKREQKRLPPWAKRPRP